MKSLYFALLLLMTLIFITSSEGNANIFIYCLIVIQTMEYKSSILRTQGGKNLDSPQLV